MKRTGILKTAALVAIALLASRAMSGDGEKKKNPGYLGVYATAAEKFEPCPETDAKSGVVIRMIYPNTPAAKAGLLEGDIIVKINDQGFSGNKPEMNKEFSDMLKKHSEGDDVKLTVVRDKYSYNVTVDGKETEVSEDKLQDLRKYLDENTTGSKIEIKAKRELKCIEITVTLGSRMEVYGQKTAPLQAKIHPEFVDKKTDLQKLTENLIEDFKINENYTDLLERLAKTEKQTDPHRLSQFMYVHRNPFRMEEITGDITERLECGKSAPRAMFRFLSTSSFLLDVKARMPRGRRLKTGLTPEEHLDQIENLLTEAVRLRDRAFRKFNEEEIKFLYENMEALGEKIIEGAYVHVDEDKERLSNNYRIVALAKKVDYAPLLKAAAVLRPLTDGKWLAALKDDFAKAGDIDKAIVATRKTDNGTIYIGGTAPHWHRAKNAAIIIDFGGKDFYAEHAGSSTAEIPVAVIIDMAGNDVYESWKSFSAASGLLGVGMIYDVEGSDSYIGLKFCQASAALGVGLLIDGAGNDTYRALYLAQGAAMWGAGGIIDLGGNDRYEAHKLSQGIGLPHGFGAIVDAKGNDFYYGKGSHPSSYGTPGIFGGFCQGCGLGFRTVASGGIGLLLDGGGKDKYEAGIFSQGGGYYFAWGILVDKGSDNDVHIGSRYAQGWSAHQASGTFMEYGGDDYYDTRNAVHAGLAWDECTSLFIDRAGNDTYYRGGFSIGASAHNSITLFIDEGGDDDYHLGGEPARSGPNEYHGGSSLSMFIDLGGGNDKYGKAKNNEIKFSGKHGFVCDLPGTIKKALSRDSYKKLIAKEKETEKKPKPNPKKNK